MNEHSSGLFDDLDWESYLEEFPRSESISPRKVDPLLPKALARAEMLIALNKIKPTKSVKKIAEHKKYVNFVEKFIDLSATVCHT
jgi:hypothetical protein